MTDPTGTIVSIAEYYGLRPEQIYSKPASRKVSHARHAIMYVLSRGGMSNRQIGRHLGVHIQAVQYGLAAAKEFEKSELEELDELLSDVPDGGVIHVYRTLLALIDQLRGRWPSLKEFETSDPASSLTAVSAPESDTTGS
jgi:hypothetical protein